MMIFWLVMATPFSHNCLMAQTNPPVWSRWLDKANLAPEFVPPTSLQAWEKERAQIRKQLWQLLGDLPPRPSIKTVHHFRAKTGAIIF